MYRNDPKLIAVSCKRLLPKRLSSSIEFREFVFPVWTKAVLLISGVEKSRPYSTLKYDDGYHSAKDHAGCRALNLLGGIGNCVKGFIQLFLLIGIRLLMLNAICAFKGPAKKGIFFGVLLDSLSHHTRVAQDDKRYTEGYFTKHFFTLPSTGPI
jgi:hypothetical protein